MTNEDFKKESWFDREYIACTNCPNQNEDEFEVHNPDDNSWEDISEDQWEDIYNEDTTETILRCKSCKTEFKIITNVTTTFDYFVKQ